VQARRRRGPWGPRLHSRTTRCLVAAGVAIVFAVPLLWLAPGASATAPATGFSVSVTASPSSGSVPLTVTFSATVSSGSAVGVTWTFGDGQTWAGAGPSALSVSHRFLEPGTFSVSALVSESTGSASGAVSVNVIDGPLVVLISASESNGTLPFTVTYRAVVSGGTGTYTSFSWGFGDGGYGSGQVVQYTYRYAGHFTATLTVVDSANDSATSSFGITAAPPASSSGPASGLMPASVLFATAGIVGVAGLTGGIYWAGRRRQQHRPRGEIDVMSEVLALPPGSADSLPASPSPAGASETLPLLVAAESSSASASSSESTLPPVGSSSVPSVASPSPLLTLTAVTSTPSQAVPTPSGTGEKGSPDEPRRWSREIVAYLGGLPTLGPDDIPTLDWTQKGMSERLGTGQNQVSNVLRRLVAAGVVVEELQHVQGQPRRLKVYRLSMRGEALAREVRRRRAGQNPNFLRRDW
jgi:hypothetical protein